MASPIWDGLRRFKTLVADGGLKDGAEKLDAILDGAMEAIADTLSTATPALLREGETTAKAALNLMGLRAAIDETSPAFLAGRVAAVADVLGFAAHQTADASVLVRARQQPYATILAHLQERAMRNVDLAAAMRKDEGQISRWLTVLRTDEVVTSHRRGREVFNALTPVGRLAVEMGVEERNHAPIQNSVVSSLAAHQPDRWNLADRRAPSDVEPEPIDRISAAG